MKKVFKSYEWLYPPIRIIFLYGLLIASVRLVALSLITYFSNSASHPHFQEINDILSSYEIILVGISAFVFVILAHSLNPVYAPPYGQMISRAHVEKKFLPGFIQGTAFAGLFVFMLILAGIYRYLGYFIQPEDLFYEFFNIFIQICALLLFTYCEEFIFHDYLKKRIFAYFLQLDQSYFSQAQVDWIHFILANLVAILYCGIKIIQFDLGVMHLLTLYLFSVSFFYRSASVSKEDNDKAFAKTAGIWAGVLIIFHPLLSLPIFGNEVSGIILIKYQPLSLQLFTSSTNSLARILSGGIGGPLSSLILQMLLILDIVKSIYLQNSRQQNPFQVTKNQSWPEGQSKQS